MQVFGPDGYPYPRDSYVERIEIPVGRTCAFCEDPIGEKDRGISVPAFEKADEYGNAGVGVAETFYHRSCVLSILGVDLGCH